MPLAILRKIKKALETKKFRWKKLKDSWDDRIQLMSAYIPAGSSVIDLGAGMMKLKKYLAPDCIYIPCDIVSRSPDTIVCNFNNDEYPPLKKYDYVFCSGVLEYISNLKIFLGIISAYSDKFLISYAVKIPEQTVAQRKKLDWVNHYSHNEICGLLKQSGFKIVDEKTYLKQKIFYLEK